MAHKMKFCHKRTFTPTYLPSVMPNSYEDTLMSVQPLIGRAHFKERSINTKLKSLTLDPSVHAQANRFLKRRNAQ